MPTRLLCLLIAALCVASCESLRYDGRTVGVVLLVHGTTAKYDETSRFDSTLQIFSYDPNSVIYQRVIWNPNAWPLILTAGNAPKEQGKYAFQAERIGYSEPSIDLSRAQVDDLRRELKRRTRGQNMRFVVDYMNWIGEIDHLANPRAIYNPQVANGSRVTFCGPEAEDGKRAPGWEGCDPERYNVDGTIERVLKAGVDEIVVVDLTTSGVRFFKSYDAIRTSRALLANYNARQGTDVTLRWVNDPGDLMRRSYPDQPANWTNSLGAPANDPRVSLAGNPNPVSSDPDYALLHVEGIEAQLRADVDPGKTGVMLVNHATRKLNQLFDPKIDDTLVLNANIRDGLLERNPGLKRAHIVGSWMGIKQRNPALPDKGKGQLERTREMRGENLGYAYLYETDEQMPGGEWGYLYWDALEYLKDQGVEHIVIAFPQITIDSVLNMVELHNQVGKELGYRTWRYIDTLDFDTYPEVGHPFADYWGVWVRTDCKVSETSDATEPCCFEMGGCADGRPYPPPRQAAPDEPRDDLDPSLAYDVSEYGHLGYDPAQGAPNPARPVQDQYSGTWATWSPPNDDPRIGQLLAKHVLTLLGATQ